MYSRSTPGALTPRLAGNHKFMRIITLYFGNQVTLHIQRLVQAKYTQRLPGEAWIIAHVLSNAAASMTYPTATWLAGLMFGHHRLRCANTTRIGRFMFQP
jgi:hypothetical protein